MADCWAMDQRLVPVILLVALLGLFAWNRWRYDVVAMMGLIAAILLGIVEPEHAFLGFGHPAVVLIAAALMISQGLNSSGAISKLLGAFQLKEKSFCSQLFVLCSLTVVVSAFINNVGAVALIIPFVISLSYHCARSPGMYLMPIAFSSLMGGMITQIGTPPNIIISAYRSEQSGMSSFRMFDFTLVGLSLSVIGVGFLVIISNILAKFVKKKPDWAQEIEHDYLTELLVDEKSQIEGVSLGVLTKRYSHINFLGIVKRERGDKHTIHTDRQMTLKKGQVLVVEATTSNLENIIKQEKFLLKAAQTNLTKLKDKDLSIKDVIVAANSNSLGRSARELDIRWHYNIDIIGIARRGLKTPKRLAEMVFQVGDLFLLQGHKDDIAKACKDFGWFDVADKKFSYKWPSSLFPTLMLFTGAIILSYLNILEITVALVSCAVLYVLFGYIKREEIYQSVEWPIIVLLAALIPIGEGMERMGSLELVVEGMDRYASNLSPEVTLGALIFVTMVLTNIINNAAAAVVMAPVAVGLAQQLGVSEDAFLMGVAVASSCAFITPIGHQSNALVMEPGGYRFIDYAYLGIPMSFFILLFSIPLLLYFWPLN